MKIKCLIVCVLSLELQVRIALTIVAYMCVTGLKPISALGVTLTSTTLSWDVKLSILSGTLDRI